MATRQPLRGGVEKIYDVITNFNKGIDKKTADDVSLDSSFKNLINFYNAAEGDLSKRPSAYDSNIINFFEALAIADYDSTKFVIKPNKFGESFTDIEPRLQDFYRYVLNGITKEGEILPDNTQFKFEADKIIEFKIIKNNFFLEAMQKYDDILKGVLPESINSDIIEFTGILVLAGVCIKFANVNTTPQFVSKENGLAASRFHIKMIHKKDYFDATIEFDAVDATMNPYKDKNNEYKIRWSYKPDTYLEGTESYIPSSTVESSNYNGYSYITSGTNYLMRIEQNPDKKVNDLKHKNESNIISQIGGYEGENLYKPTPIELTQIGFNILSNDPLTFINKEGETKKVRGIFFSVEIEKEGTKFKQPIAKAPYNSPFYIHVLYTGDQTPEDIKYREDNGETDTTKNPYKVLPGAWEDASKTIWKCTGIDSAQKLELYIKLGVDEFRTYITTSSTPIEETGYINEISKLVFSSTHSKIINNQLVLYGGHGYIFFSEYDVFNYFPNYYYIYVASEAGEEAVTNISYFRQYYAIFTNRRIKRMTGSFGSDDFGIYPLSDFVGCPNGRTVHPVGNNLLFLGSDGVYKLKQGYLGEGTENIEKIDNVLDGELNINNVIQAFVMSNNYVVVKNDGRTWMVYNTQTDAFYEYDLEARHPMVYKGSQIDTNVLKKALPFYTVFHSNLYDENGDFVVIPMYHYNYEENYTKVGKAGFDLMLFRFNELNFLDNSLRHQDGAGFISKLETHYMNMGYPTHTKKFKYLYIKIINNSGHIIPLYVKILVDDKVVVSPEDYKIAYNTETSTYYYVKDIFSNFEIYTTRALGEFVIGKDKLGNKTIQQLKIRIGAKGRGIKLILSDGYNDYTNIIIKGENSEGFPIRNRNIHDFSVSTIGIVYKLKKVKEG